MWPLPMIWEIVSCRLWKHSLHGTEGGSVATDGESRSRAYGALSAWVLNFVVPRYMFTVPPHVFRPRPKVDSAVVRFDPHPAPAWSEARALSRILKVLFQQRRKQLGTILKPWWTEEMDRWCRQWHTDRRARPEELSPDMLRSLALIVPGP